MRVTVSGLIMEIKPEYDEKKNRLSTVTAMIFQKGEKALIAMKKIPAEMVDEGLAIENVPARVMAWSIDGNYGLSCSYSG